MKDDVASLISANQGREHAAWPERSAVVADRLGQYLRIWSEATPADDRLETALRIFAPDGVYKDPMTAQLDPQGLVRHVEDVVLPQLSDFHLRSVGTPQIHGRYVLFSWAYVAADGCRVSFPGSSGTDFVQFSENGLLQEVIGFFDVTLLAGGGPL